MGRIMRRRLGIIAVSVFTLLTKVAVNPEFRFLHQQATRPVWITRSSRNSQSREWLFRAI